MKLPHTRDVPDALYEAARVSRFMDEGEVGRWQLRHFTVTDDEYAEKLTGLHYTSEHPEEEKARAVPPGSYITLRRRMIDHERRSAVKDHLNGLSLRHAARKLDMTEEELIAKLAPDDVAYIPVMSDTPAEICEHDHALLHAKGAVLITGLGLGCLPHALLTKPEVTSIDIIDIDPEVIQLTGHYLTDPRVTIHQGSAADPVAAGVKAGRQFDYVWHDIWTHVSDRNLSDATAEHGISYRRLFKLYDRLYHCGQQNAWALPLAKHMKRLNDQVRAEEQEFRRRLKASPLDEQIEMMKLRIARDKIVRNEHTEIDDETCLRVFAMIDPDGELEAHLRLQLTDPGFWAGLEAHDRKSDAFGHPNAHLEAA